MSTGKHTANPEIIKAARAATDAMADGGQSFRFMEGETLLDAAKRAADPMDPNAFDKVQGALVGAEVTLRFDPED